MNFTIDCDTFVRLSNVCKYFENPNELDLKKRVNAIRLENVNGKRFAIVTNGKIACVENLGETEELDGAVTVALTEELLQQCRLDALFGASLIVTSIPELALATGQISNGTQLNGNIATWYDDNPLDRWREWLPDETPKASKGSMFWNTMYIETLFNASPTGLIYFQEFVDVEQPIILRDYNDKNWFGLFLAAPQKPSIISEGATLPDWYEA